MSDHSTQDERQADEPLKDLPLEQLDPVDIEQPHGGSSLTSSTEPESALLLPAIQKVRDAATRSV